MSSMKGFIHVIEIIIVSLLVFLVIIQFSYLPSVETDWSGTKLTLQANDLLFSLDKTGLNWLDSDDVDGNLSAMLPDNTIYRVIVIDEDSNVTSILDNPVPKNSVTISFYKPMSGNIYEVILTLGYLY